MRAFFFAVSLGALATGCFYDPGPDPSPWGAGSPIFYLCDSSAVTYVPGPGQPAQPWGEHASACVLEGTAAEDVRAACIKDCLEQLEGTSSVTTCVENMGEPVLTTLPCEDIDTAEPWVSPIDGLVVVNGSPVALSGSVRLAQGTGTLTVLDLDVATTERAAVGLSLAGSSATFVIAPDSSLQLAAPVLAAADGDGYSVGEEAAAVTASLDILDSSIGLGGAYEGWARNPAPIEVTVDGRGVTIFAELDLGDGNQAVLSAWSR